jgi:hypothetical protein
MGMALFICPAMRRMGLSNAIPPSELSRNSAKFIVMPGLVPGIHVLASARLARRTWMAGISSAKTRFALLPGHDDL